MFFNSLQTAPSGACVHMCSRMLHRRRLHGRASVLWQSVNICRAPSTRGEYQSGLCACKLSASGDLPCRTAPTSLTVVSALRPYGDVGGTLGSSRPSPCRAGSTPITGDLPKNLRIFKNIAP
jgi:hypothetical protein